MDVLHKFSDEVYSRVSLADKKAIKDAMQMTKASVGKLKKMSNYERKDILLSLASQIKARHEELSQVLVAEVGKTITDARGEVGRAIDTFTIAAEESVRKHGEYGPVDLSQRNKGYSNIVSRFPIGLVSMIVPFNFPINLAAHKIAPAIAVGCPFVLKPSERTPMSAILLGEMLSQTTLPPESYAILPCAPEDASLFSTDENIDFISFTGSAKVGWGIKSNSGKKKLSLELGGNAACIVEDASNLDYVVNRLSFGAFYGNGQSCISVQRIYVNEAVYDQLVPALVKKAQSLTVGDPSNEKTFIGPLIAELEAKRLESWIIDAVSAGARLLVGGKRDGKFMPATIVENVPTHCKLSCEEVFGCGGFKDILRQVNDSIYGLQAGIFTSNINKAFYAYENLDVGGVVINDIPSARVDSMPYGGVKQSGLGREGIRYAMEDMTELRVMLMKDISEFNDE